MPPEPVVTETACTAMCAFDHGAPVDGTYDYGCHFTVFDGSTCYLGSIGYERGDLLSSLPSGHNLNLKSCTLRNKVEVTRH